MKYLIVGLGNTGVSYEHTRHNVGFMAIDRLLALHNTYATTVKLGAKAAITYKGRQLHLIKPTGYMNQSGKSVNYWVHKLAIPKSNLLVIVDDIAIPFGHIRLRGQGSHGGHNGLRHIEELLESADFPRLRVGIDHTFVSGQQAQYVLSPFSSTEQETLPKLLDKIGQTVHSFCFAGLERTMNLFNGPLAEE